MNALILDFWFPDVERRKLSCCKPTVSGARVLQLQDGVRCLKPGSRQPPLACVPWAGGSVCVSLSFQKLRS